MNKPDLFGDEPMTCRHLDVVCVVKTFNPTTKASLPSGMLGHIAHVVTRRDGMCWLASKHTINRPNPNHPSWTAYEFEGIPAWAVVHICDPVLVRAATHPAAKGMSMAKIIETFYRSV